MTRIAIGGWQHETNTFATIRADYAAFVAADEWPGLTEGESLVSDVRDVHLPIAGAIEAIESRGNTIAPLLWCSATPCSYVTEDAFEKICARLVRHLSDALPVDGVYLDLHGAMVCEHLEDGEGEILSRVRQCVGRDIPVAVSLDLHANITSQMVEMATIIDVFRTYPHIDMGETGYRVASSLCDLLENPRTIYHAFRQVDFLIPLNTGCTLFDPCRSLYRQIPEMLGDGVTNLSLACGFHLSDIHDVGPSIVGYGIEAAAVESVVEQLHASVMSKQSDFYQKIWPAKDAVAEARLLFASHRKPVVLADTQDNPGGGGAGDTIGLLQAMIEAGLENSVIGVINDAEVAAMAHAAGQGAVLDLVLGGKAGVAGQDQLRCRAQVVGISDGRFTATGPMYHGAHMEIGPACVLDIDGVLAVVCSKAVQAADQQHFRHIGVDPAAMDYVAVKSSVHFRNDFQEMAGDILVVASPGEVYADPATLHYANARAALEITSMS